MSEAAVLEMPLEAVPANEDFFLKMDAQEIALTYDDVRLRTTSGQRERLPDQLDLTTRFSTNVELKLPFVSAAMDTVTTAPMAIEMAKLGGLGIIHYGLDAKTQRKEVRRVKLHMNGRIDNPITVCEDQSIESVLNMCQKRDFDFRTFPVVNNEGRFVGLLTQNDFDFCLDSSKSVKAFMTRKVYTATGDLSIKSAYKEMNKHKKKTLPVLDADGRVTSMYLHSDVRRIVEDRDQYNTDENGQLIVGAAVPTSKEGLRRVRMMQDYVDVVVLDSADGDSYYSFKYLEKIKEEFPNLDVVVGNISDGVAARELVVAGADGIKVGQGPGSICTTRIETGIGMPQVTAVSDCAREMRKLGDKYDVPGPCADGGIRWRGDISIAIAAGAGTVMMGKVLAGSDESPGRVVVGKDGLRQKEYRGMGSASSLRESATARKRYHVKNGEEPLTEGVEGRVPYTGPVKNTINLCAKGLEKSMRYVKTRTIAEHQAKSRFRRITGAGLAESRPHDIQLAP